MHDSGRGGRSLPPVIINCLPKAGTHLIKRLFQHLPLYKDVGFSFSRKTATNCSDPHSRCLVGVADPVGIEKEAFVRLLDRLEKNRYLVGHLPYTEASRELIEERQVRMLLLLRDPRDVACSFVHYVLRKRENHFHRHFSRLPDMPTRLKSVIDGIAASACPDDISLRSVAEQFASVGDWSAASNTFHIFFEDLVGEDGGGSRKLQ